MVDKISDRPALGEGWTEEITRSGDVHEARRLFAKLVASHGSENDFDTKVVDAFLGKLGEEPPSVGTVTALSCLVDRGVSVDRIRSDERLPRAMEYLETSGKVSAADLDDFRRSFDMSVGTAVKSLETHSHSEEEEEEEEEEEGKSDIGLWETIREAVLEEDDEGVAEGEPPTAGLSSMLYKGYQNFKASVDELAQAVEDDVGDDSCNDDGEEEESVGVLLRRGLESMKETASGIAQVVDDDDDDSNEQQGSSSWVAGLATSSLDYLKTSVVALAASVDSPTKGEGEDSPKKEEEEEDASSLAGALVGGWSLV